jgi:hypothetical protein
MLGTELLLSSRERMTLEVRAIFWFISHSMPYQPKGLELLGTELSLSSRGRMTLRVGEIFWFISHTLPQCHALQGVGDTYL